MSDSETLWTIACQVIIGINNTSTLKMTIKNVFNDLRKNRNIRNQMMGNISREMQTIKRNQMKIL